MKLLVVTLLALASLSLLLLPASGGSIAGGWSPIKNITDPHVTEIGDFAVSEHNKTTGDDLKFVKVTKGERQVVAGLNYKLVLEAENGKGKIGKYQAVVWEKEWAGFRQLTSFNPV